MPAQSRVGWPGSGQRCGCSERSSPRRELQKGHVSPGPAAVPGASLPPAPMPSARRQPGSRRGHVRHRLAQRGSASSGLWPGRPSRQMPRSAADPGRAAALRHGSRLSVEHPTPAGGGRSPRKYCVVYRVSWGSRSSRACSTASSAVTDSPLSWARASVTVCTGVGAEAAAVRAN